MKMHEKCFASRNGIKVEIIGLDFFWSEDWYKAHTKWEEFLHISRWLSDLEWFEISKSLGRFFHRFSVLSEFFWSDENKSRDLFTFKSLLTWQWIISRLRSSLMWHLEMELETCRQMSCTIIPSEDMTETNTSQIMKLFEKLIKFCFNWLGVSP